MQLQLYTISGFIILFGGIVFFLLAVILYFKKKVDITNYLAFYLFLSISLLLIEHYYYNYHYNTKIITPFRMLLLNIHFLIGPIVYMIVHSFYSYKKTIKEYYPHFVPFIVSQLITLFYPFVKFPYLQHGLLIIIYTVHMTVYIVISSGYTFFLLCTEHKYQRQVVKITLFILLYTIFSFLIYFIFDYKMNIRNINISTVLLALLAIPFFVLTHTHTDFFYNTGNSLRTIRYRRSLIKGLDVNLVSDRFMELFEKEKIYCDENLNLNRLAAHMEMPPHQLSEFINSYYKTNFKALLNKYRIKKAKQLLLENQDRSILDIAYSAGFNSKTTFYRLFSQEVGVLPNEYREKNDKFLK